MIVDRWDARTWRPFGESDQYKDVHDHVGFTVQKLIEAASQNGL